MCETTMVGSGITTNLSKEEKMKQRKLISLYKHSKTLWHISFSYYVNGQYTGESEEADLTEDELYDLLRPGLTLDNPLERSSKVIA